MCFVKVFFRCVFVCVRVCAYGCVFKGCLLLVGRGWTYELLILAGLDTLIIVFGWAGHVNY